MSDETRTPEERVEDLPRILDAMRRGVHEALIRHQFAGNPVAEWRDGAVIWVQPEQLLADEVRSGE
jgi:hypothetical protein